MTRFSIFWFRRDLRLHDNAGLFHALKAGQPVLPIFIFDRNILDDLTERQDARVDFIIQAVHRLKQALEAQGSTLLMFYGKPEAVWMQLAQQASVSAVYCNRDYEPYAEQRDRAVTDILNKQNIAFKSSKDHVIFEKDEVLKADGTPYTVFTPYSRRWLEKLTTKAAVVSGSAAKESPESFFLQSYPVERYASHFLKTNDLPDDLKLLARRNITLEGMGFVPASITFPEAIVPRGLIKSYDKTRDFPAIDGTSRLGIHFRFGTISIREKARHAQQLNGTYLNELIWRDFYSQILANFPHVVDKPFRPQYDRIAWLDAPEDFERWCAGETGYPIVDAGMRQLNTSGFMHNRVRMIVASFLSKHLLIDWRKGEAYFAQKLLDYDLASNSGGWQWAAGCGTDAAPYFRIFNPTEQAKKFDPESKYIRKWVPEFGTARYPLPMVDHVFARNRCLETYKKALG